MRFGGRLIKGELLRRYKRFLADVRLADGSIVTAHCPNTGSMKTCGSPGDTVYLSHNPSPKRKLHYTWELTRVGRGYIGVNTAKPNRVVEEAIRDGCVEELRGYDIIRREVPYGKNSRIDLLLEDSRGHRPPCYVEVKNTTLLCDNMVTFPDAVTTRGLKHLTELAKICRKGTARAVMFYLVNRPDGNSFRIAGEIDPDYFEAFKLAENAGVEMLAYRTRITTREIKVESKVPALAK